MGYECFDDHPDAIPVEAEAGSIVIFSSLTPHKTGPNVSEEIRKAYIVQYAPDEAQLLHGEPHAGPPESKVLANESDRQFPILIDGAVTS